MIQDCVDTMTAMNVKVAFLPLGEGRSGQRIPELRPAIVERLKWRGNRFKSRRGHRRGNLVASR